MTRWLAIIPIALLIGFAVIGGVNLLSEDRPAPGLSDGRLAPERAFDRLYEDGAPLRFNPPPSDGPVVVNLFASWCEPCRSEHPLLTELAARKPGQVYGILYDDTPAKGAEFLSELGDPFAAIGHDPDGQGGLEFGLTGVPETFVINSEGRIIRHVRGVLTPALVEEIEEIISD